MTNKVVVDKENVMPKAKAAIRGKKTKSVEQVPSPEKVLEENQGILGKRKPRVNYNTEAAKRTERKATIKLFQDTLDVTNTSMTSNKKTNDSCTDIEKQLKAVGINESPIVANKSGRGGKKTMKSSNSVTNLRARTSTRGKASDKDTATNKENNPKVESKKRKYISL